LPTWGLPVGEVQAKQQSTSAQNTSTADGTTSEKADPAELGTAIVAGVWGAFKLGSILVDSLINTVKRDEKSDGSNKKQ